ncbi:SRPBCC family protein [Mucilaginibacter lappiensis]|uniref:Uncharacterized protein YndB with AHSA1/START domain n=1 Tax=Mucilaginibacter lappiensis TaxID=354630 RepID=A0A1N7CZV1_9SPHI|nr:SRPBCC domain-containing protein [Mucilaginibacter lappiensis]MBB6111092.1 uncharacterized protein YndB with AHSA1/START domain [Mucilaginibacter lappiensis]MBB6128783.1 uncharacterized protein YndB with AHSA1/START domain [Mucilaginibacter lappiensis]SIR69109.1 Uncharacterized conserved protein YndB, AHSA1/START domain [Mucilaginibacter lappiensis]
MSVDNSQSFSINHYFPVLAELVLDAWLDPEIMKLWMFKSPTNKITDIKVEPWINGNFSILELEHGEEIDHFGQYKELIEPNRLVFTLEVPKHFAGVTLVEVDIESDTAGCKLTLTQTGVSADVTRPAWIRMMEDLDVVLRQNSQ